MPPAVLDSDVIVAAANVRDADHPTGLEIVEGVDTGELPNCRVSNYVIAEVSNFLHARTRHEYAIELYDRLERGNRFLLDHATKEDYHRAVELFTASDRLTFGDATIVAYMRREGLSYRYSFDSDFDAVEGITRLDVAEDPFA